jgi:hypothetical protein
LVDGHGNPLRTVPAFGVAFRGTELSRTAESPRAFSATFAALSGRAQCAAEGFDGRRGESVTITEKLAPRLFRDADHQY